MKISLNADAEKLIKSRLKSGRYKTANDVVLAGLALLDQRENAGNFDPGELDRLIAMSEKSGDALDGEAVFAELKDLGRRYKGKLK